MEFTVAGKKVVLRERITLGEGYDIIGLFSSIDTNDQRTSIPIMVKMIESWEFEGEPDDPASYDQMDVLTEVIPMSRKINGQINIMMSGMEEVEEEPEKNQRTVSLSLFLEMGLPQTWGKYCYWKCQECQKP